MEHIVMSSQAKLSQDKENTQQAPSLLALLILNCTINSWMRLKDHKLVLVIPV